MILSFHIANKSFSNRQLKWELLNMKFENLQLTILKIKLKKIVNKKNKTKQLKILETSLKEDDNLSQYSSIKNELDAIYDHITKGMPIRNKCNWHERSAKSTLFFWNLEK